MGVLGDPSSRSSCFTLRAQCADAEAERRAESRTPRSSAWVLGRSGCSVSAWWVESVWAKRSSSASEIFYAPRGGLALTDAPVHTPEGRGEGGAGGRGEWPTVTLRDFHGESEPTQGPRKKHSTVQHLGKQCERSVLTSGPF